MAKHKKHHGRGGFKLPLAVVGGFMPLVGGTLRTWQNAGWSGDGGAGVFLTAYGTGWDPVHGKFSFSNLSKGLGPVVLGILVHKIVGGTLGVNRLLGKMGIPIIRI